MKKLVQRFSGLVKGTLSGFDRIVFKGCILPLMLAAEVMIFCQSKGILNKHYKSWVMEQTNKIVKAADQYAKQHSGHPITHLTSWKIRKEALAQERQQSPHRRRTYRRMVPAWSPVHLSAPISARKPAIRYCDPPVIRCFRPEDLLLI